VPDATSTPAASDIDAAAHRRLGVELFNYAWTLVEEPDRTPAEIDEMIHAAHASCFHWSKVGTNANLGRGEWQIARGYSVLGRPEPARWHAGRCLAYVEAAIAAGEAEDWDLAAAREARRLCPESGPTGSALSSPEKASYQSWHHSKTLPCISN